VILSTGHYAQVRKVGTRAGHPIMVEGVLLHHTLHIVDFWPSQADHDAGNPPVHTEDFETQWSEPHPDPGSRLLGILEQYVTHMSGGSLQPDHHWSDAPDVHGNLSHPSMATFQPVKH
jgi:hypothetical protein